MLLQPLEEIVQVVMELIPIVEAIRFHSDKLHPGPGARLVAQHKLARELFGGREEVRDAFWGFPLLLQQSLFKFVDIPSCRMQVMLWLLHKLTSVRGHRLNKVRQNLIQVFVSLKVRGEEEGGIKN